MSEINTYPTLVAGPEHGEPVPKKLHPRACAIQAHEQDGFYRKIEIRPDLFAWVHSEKTDVMAVAIVLNYLDAEKSKAARHG